jgi:hypothetical protein
MVRKSTAVCRVQLSERPPPGTWMKRQYNEPDHCAVIPLLNDGMLSKQQRIDDTVQAAAWREARRFRLRREMPGLRSSQMELPLQIVSSNVDVADGHLGINVSE